MSNREQYTAEDTSEIKGLWISYLEEFKKKFYPVFKSHGFTLPEAMNVFFLNRISQSLIPDDEEDPKEPWRL